MENDEWLDDQQIEALRAERSPEAADRALMAAQTRAAGLDPVSVKPFRATDLEPFAGEAGWEQADAFVRLLLEVEQVPRLLRDEGLSELARAAAFYVGLTGQAALSLALKVMPEPEAAARAVLRELGDLAPGLPSSRLHAVEHFVETLLEGEAPLPEASLSTIRTWPESPLMERVERIAGGMTSFKHDQAQ